MIIDVTQDDIDNGVPSISTKCPIALAAQRQFVVDGAVVEVSHHSLSVYAFREGEGWVWTEHRLPLSARAWISAYDKHRDVLPFSFEVE
jgi:hypothetical protein